MTAKTKSKVTPEMWAAVFHRLGKEPDAIIARELGVDTSVVQRQRYRSSKVRFQKVTPEMWDRVLDRLGVERDRVIAAELGVTRQRVEQKRKELGIKRRPKVADLVTENQHLLGVATDEAVAQALGIDSGTIGHVRRELGIPTYQESHPPECGTRRRYAMGCRCEACRRENALTQSARSQYLKLYKTRRPHKYDRPEDIVEVDLQVEEWRERDRKRSA